MPIFMGETPECDGKRVAVAEWALLNLPVGKRLQGLLPIEGGLMWREGVHREGKCRVGTLPDPEWTGGRFGMGLYGIERGAYSERLWIEREKRAGTSGGRGE